MEETKEEKRNNDGVNSGCAMIFGLVIIALLFLGLYDIGMKWWHYILITLGVAAFMFLLVKIRLFYVDGID